MSAPSGQRCAIYSETRADPSAPFGNALTLPLPSEQSEASFGGGGNASSCLLLGEFGSALEQRCKVIFLFV